VHRLIFRNNGDVIAEGGHYNLTWDHAVEVWAECAGINPIVVPGR
jgi:hypothetical protein